MGTVGAIVLGGLDSPTGLGVIRSLGEKGLQVIAVDDKPDAIGFCSKFAEDGFLLTSNEEKKIPTLLKLGFKRKGWVLIPASDYYVTLVSQNWKTLSKYFVLTTPPWGIVRYCIDKLLTYNMAEKAGIPIPQTFCPKNGKELKKISEQIDFKNKSWILKSRSRALFPRLQKGLFYKRKAVEIESKKDLLEQYIKTLETTGESMLIQEIIPGMPDKNVVLETILNYQSKPVVVFTNKKIRQHPLFFGFGSYRESIYEPSAINFGLNLLKTIRYYGMAYIEFKRDPRDGKLKLIEINPRFTSGISLAKACGINLPHILYNSFLNIECKVCQKYKIGVRWWHINYDLYTIFSNRTLLPWKETILDIISNIGRTKAFANFSMEDPFPFFISFSRYIRQGHPHRRNWSGVR